MSSSYMSPTAVVPNEVDGYSSATVIVWDYEPIRPHLQNSVNTLQKVGSGGGGGPVPANLQVFQGVQFAVPYQIKVVGTFTSTYYDICMKYLL